MGKWSAAVVLSLLWCSSSNGRASPIATVGHVAHARLLLAPIAATGTLTLADRCYCGARGMRAGATSTHNSDGPSDISGQLLLPPTVAMGDMTSDDRCYCWARGTRAGAISAHSSDSRLTSANHCYYHQQ
jgi:hypothetical protein